MSDQIMEHVVAVLRSAGPDGLTIKQITLEVERLRGCPVTPGSVGSTISSHRNRHRDPKLRLTINAAVRRWTLAPAEAEQPPAPPQLDYGSAQPHSLTAALMGDPLPGRSALDVLERERTHADA